ncbi:MAG TPA: alpha/beta hydrolase, partial [Opitutaceae bacterium]|nr:alpha/beta hydrolase [Opitutaceae bacterium]
ESDLIPIAQKLSPGSALLSPRGDVSEHGARRFFARLAEGVFDPAEVTRRTVALADFVVAASKHYSVDPRRLIAVGFSNGANVAATMMLLRPEVLGAGILFRPMVVLDQPAQRGTLAGRRVLLANGSVDPLVSPDDPPRLAALLRAGGAEVDVEVLQASHQLTPQDVALAQAWMRK